jgi:hypothetical protein
MRPILAIAVAAAVVAGPTGASAADRALQGAGIRVGPVLDGPVHRKRVRHVRRHVAVGALAYGLFPSYYAYDDPCILPRRVWSPYGAPIEWINVCY